MVLRDATQSKQSVHSLNATLYLPNSTTGVALLWRGSGHTVPAGTHFTIPCLWFLSLSQDIFEPWNEPKERRVIYRGKRRVKERYTHKQAQESLREKDRAL